MNITVKANPCFKEVDRSQKKGRCFRWNLKTNLGKRLKGMAEGIK